MEKFLLRLGLPGGESHGVATFESTDGQLRLSVLGATAAATQAKPLLEHHLRSDTPAPALLMPEIGYVVENLRSARTLVFASPIGLKQIFWTFRQDKLSLASEPASLLQNAAGSTALAPDSLYCYLYFHFLPGPASAFENVAKLDSGHMLALQGGHPRVERWWRPSFVSNFGGSVDAASAELRRLLESAVAHSLASSTRSGAFLSGGLDSSTITGFAARAMPGIPTVSMGFDAEGYDEMQYARIASKHFGTRSLEYYVTPEDVLRTLPDIAAAFSEPFGNSSAAAAFHCARIAREQGLDTLLAGDGGDEIFGGNDRYATQQVFERYARVPGLLRAVLEAGVGAAAACTQRFPVGKAQSYIRQAKIGLPDRLQEYNFLHRIAPEDVFDADLLLQVDRSAPLAMLREEYAVPKNADALNRMLFLDWKFTLHDNDLVKVNTMCELAGVKVAYPMLDPELIDFSLRLPSEWKIRHGNLRWFFKQALRDFLPREIIGKTKHGFGLPFGNWTRTHTGLQRMVAESLDSLAKRRYFRPDFIAQAQRLHREGHASYYGELVWILMVLELWLQRHMPRAGL